MNLTEFARKHEDKLRYLCVSAWNYVFGNIVYAALVTRFAPAGASWLHVPAYEWMLVPANVIGITNNFLGYKLVVFRTKGHYLAEYARTYVVYAPIILAQVFALPLLVHLLHLDPRLANPLWGFVAFVIAYFAHRFFTFRTAEQKLEEIDAEEAPAEGASAEVLDAGVAGAGQSGAKSGDEGEARAAR